MPRRGTSVAVAALVCCATFGGTGAARADTPAQTSVGLTVGYGARDLREDPHGAFHLGGRADLLLLRSRNRDMAFGPYVEGLTVAFSDLQMGGGLEWLIPGLDEPAIVLSAGAFGRHTGPFGWEPGAAAGLFVGFRELNFHGVYGMANGLFVQGRLGFGDSHQAEVLGGLQVDLAIFTLPFLLLWGALD